MTRRSRAGLLIVVAVAVLAAQGERSLVLCTGGRTEKAAMTLRPGNGRMPATAA